MPMKAEFPTLRCAMDDELDLEFETEIVIPEQPKAKSRTPAARALVVEDDADLTRIALRQLSSLEIHSDVVWTRQDAMAALSRRDEPLAFAYVDARILGTNWAGAVAEIRALRPTLPVVVATREIGDVLAGDGTAICKPFTPEQFRAAFDASLFDLQIRQVLLDAAAAVRAFDAAEAALVAAGMPPTLPLSA
jgi:DNA-binding response OmpR family regulator